MVTYNMLKSLEIKHKVLLLGRLLTLQEQVQAGKYPITGICGQLDVGISVIRQYLESWPRYSGNCEYPVPNLGGVDYLGASLMGRLWADTPYGNARRDLLTHCINEVQKELANYHALMLGLQEVYKNPDRSGICHQRVLNYVRDREHNLARLFVGWPMHSGSIRFPVPEDAGYSGALNQYYHCTNRWSGDYGERRRNLLVYCIDQLKTGLGSYTP